MIVTGVSTNSCVLFTAQDAYMRDVQINVPRDCAAASAPEEHQSALEQMRGVIKADVRPSAEISFEA